MFLKNLFQTIQNNNALPQNSEWRYSTIDVKHLSSSINELFPTSSSGMEVMQFPLAKDLKIK